MEEIKALNQQLEELGAEQEAQIEKTKEINEKLRNRIALIQSMSKVYFASFFIDVTKDTFEEIRSTQSVRNVIGTSGKAQETLYMICDKMVSPETADNLREFVNLSTIDARLRETDIMVPKFQTTTRKNIVNMVKYNKNSKRRRHHDTKNIHTGVQGQAGH